MVVKIGSNIASLQAQRSLNDATASLQDSYTRLSTGLRINKTSDDAAGLAISENLSTDARISNQAIRNVNDGISMVSIITGALDAQKDVLFRMAELAEQSANGVYTSAQREIMQDEYMSLQEEFDRIAGSTTFNDISLLRNSSKETITFMAGITGANESLLTMSTANSHRFAGNVFMNSDVNDDGIIDFDDFDLFDFSSYTGPHPNPYQVGVFKVLSANNEEITIRLNFSRLVNDFGASPGDATTNAAPSTLSLISFARLASGEEDTYSKASFQADFDTVTLEYTFAASSDSASVTLDFSDFTYEWATNTVTADDVKETNIGLTNILQQQYAQSALDTVKNRIDEVSLLQGDFGVIQSRLQIATQKLFVDRENFLSAASQIKDADIASEVANLSRFEILQQSATAVLAQANQQPGLVNALL